MCIHIEIIVIVQFKFKVIIDYKGANYAMANKAVIHYTDLIANVAYLKVLNVPSLCLEKLSIVIFHLLDGVSMVYFKPTIYHINILIKVQLISIVTVSDSETHSESERY